MIRNGDTNHVINGEGEKEECNRQQNQGFSILSPQESNHLEPAPLILLCSFNSKRTEIITSHKLRLILVSQEDPNPDFSLCGVSVLDRPNQRREEPERA